MFSKILCLMTALVAAVEGQHTYTMYSDSACTNAAGIVIPVVLPQISSCNELIEMTASCEGNTQKLTLKSFSVAGCTGEPVTDVTYLLDGNCNSAEFLGITQYYKSSTDVPCAVFGDGDGSASGLIANLAIIAIALVAALL